MNADPKRLVHDRLATLILAACDGRDIVDAIMGHCTSGH